MRIVDPACGSGHFLLYCFDLLETIYEEAYADPDLHATLAGDFPSLSDLRKAIPGLILSRNLYGIDIDRRATQIAALALWLRAQRSFEDAGLTGSDRPRICRANIVCAEPMPGERDLLEEFVAGLEPKLLAQLVRAVFERMQLAGEAGSLLKIEEEIRESVSEAKRQWMKKPKLEQMALFPGIRRRESEQADVFDFSGISDEQFWDEAEAGTLEALRDYAERADNGRNLLRRLFAGDAAGGFAFIDVCTSQFDVVLMNPPFGEASKPSKGYIEKAYPRTKNDVYAAFVERWITKLVHGGMLGAMTSRTGFFLSSFQKWREEILLQEVQPTVFADLGYGVLDTAMVETAAYCLIR